MKKSIQVIITLTLLFCVNILGQYPNILIDNSGSPEEVTIAISPLNPNVLAGGANIDCFYRSTNGGLNWTESQLISNNLGVWGDPVVLFDSLGNLCYAHLSNPMSGWWIDRIVVQRSTNNGLPGMMVLELVRVFNLRHKIKNGWLSILLNLLIVVTFI
jgi:hypothetical protein